MPADLVEVAAALETLVATLDDHQAYALGAFGRVGLAGDDHQVGELAIGDEDLLARDHQLIAVTDRLGLDALQVGSGTRLGHRDGADHLAGNHLRQPFLLLLLSAVLEDVGRDDLRMQVIAAAGGVGVGQFLHEHGAVEKIGPQAAVFLRHRTAKESLLAGLQPGLAADLAVLLPLVVVGGDLLVDEALDGVPEHAVLLAENGS